MTEALYNIFDWYWVVGDTNPTTKVFQSSSGTYINNTAADYVTWVSTINSGPQLISGATDNGSGLIRLAVENTSTLVTNDRWVVTGVGGTTEANATWPITVIDATHVDLQGSAFVHAYTSGGYFGRGTTIDTETSLMDLMNEFNTNLFETAAEFTSITLNSASLTTISTPVSKTYKIRPGTSDGAQLSIPNYCMPGAFPIGHPIYFIPDLTAPAANQKSWFLGDGTVFTSKAHREGVIFFVTANDPTGVLHFYSQLIASVDQPTADAQILVSDTGAASTGNWTARAVSGDATIAVGGALTVKGIGNITTGTLGLAHGGTHVDLSATGGTSKFLRQNSSGADITVVQPASTDLSDTTAPTAFVPTDQSGASLTFTSTNMQYNKIGNMVNLYGNIVYPVTASGANATISLPVAVPAGTYAIVAGFVRVAGGNPSIGILTANGASTASFFDLVTGASITNVNLSAKTIRINLSYPAT